MRVVTALPVCVAFVIVFALNDSAATAQTGHELAALRSAHGASPRAAGTATTSGPALTMPLAGQSPTAPATDQPTLQETFDWIVSKLPDMTVSVRGVGTSGTSTSIRSPQFWRQDCEVQFVEYRAGVNGQTVSSGAYAAARDVRRFVDIRFNLRELSLSTLRGSSTSIFVSATGSRQVIAFHDFSDIVREDGSRFIPDSNIDGRSASLEFSTERDLAPRLLKALEHAITLCGGSNAKEPF